VPAKHGGSVFFACLDEGEGGSVALWVVGPSGPRWAGGLVGHGAKWAEMGCSG
jgi:hypothetical protein